MGYSSLSAQVKLSGQIRDADSREPLYGVLIQVENQTQTAVLSDFEGNYSLELSPGAQTILFSYLGYPDERRELQVGSSDLTLNLDWQAGLTNEVVVVTESRYARRLEESTVSVDVVTPKMLENNNLTSLDGIVSKVSGVQMMDGQVSIRGGAGFAYGAGSRVSFLVDGQLLLSAELSDVKWNFVPIENAEQVEVIKGSASVLYGSGALNGVINVRTASPRRDQPYTAVSTYAGLYSKPKDKSMAWIDKYPVANTPAFWGGFFSHRQKLGKEQNFDLVLGGNFHIENNFIQGADERRFRLNFNTRYRPDPLKGRMSYGVNGNIMYHELGTFFLPRNMRDGAFIRNGGGRDRYSSFTLDPYFLIYDKHNNKHEIKARWFNITKRRGAQPSVGDLVNLEYLFQREFSSGTLLSAGGLIQSFTANSILFNDNQNPDIERALFGGYSGALFAQAEQKFLNNRLSTVVGVRWEVFQIDTMTSPTPPVLRFGLNYALSPKDHLRASFGQGFRVPSLAERFINEPLAVGGIRLGIYPNPSLRPEIGWSSELAYRRSFRSENFRFYTDLALFWMEYKDMVEFRFDFYREGLGFKTINVAQARIAGWELSAQADGQIGRVPLRLWGGYTYNYAADMEQDSSLRQARVFVNSAVQTFIHGVNRDNPDELNRLLKYRSLHTLRMDLETDLGPFSLGFVANYNSFVHAIDAIFESPAVMPGLKEFREANTKGNLTLDARLAYRFNDKQRLVLLVNNLSNTLYEVRPARMGAPRHVVLKYAHVF